MEPRYDRAALARILGSLAHPALLALGFPVVGANHESGVGTAILDWVAACPPLDASLEHAGAAAPA